MNTFNKQFNLLMQSLDYYKDLGVSKTANQNEIKRAFRKLALKYHPDKNNGSKQSAQKFKEVYNAYEVLSNDQNRRNYDRKYQEVRNASYKQHNPFEYLYESILFENIDQLKEKAQSGDPDDVFKYCRYALYSTQTKNKSQIIKLLQENAQKNHAQSQFLLGKMYSKGFWVPRNQKKGLEWYLKAMENGHKVAKYEAGMMFLHGKGVQKNVKFGNMLINQSIEEVEDYCSKYGYSANLTALFKKK